MNRTLIGLVAAVATLTAPFAFAHGDGAHAPQARDHVASQVVDTPFGREGDPRQASRTLTVDMTDNMRFTPGTLTVKRGETVRLKVANKGQVMHEFVLGTEAQIRKHWAAMKQHPGMQHDEPSMVHVAPGKTGEVVWQFTQPGEFQFACLLPGHFEAGMSGRVVVK